MLEKVFNIQNNYPGVCGLESHLLSVMEKNHFEKLKIGAESTAFLDLHLVDFLASSEPLSHFSTEVYQLNPKIISGFKKAYPHKEKTDKADAFVIADRLRFGRLPEPYRLHEGAETPAQTGTGSYFTEACKAHLCSLEKGIALPGCEVKSQKQNFSELTFESKFFDQNKVSVIRTFLLENRLPG